MAEERSAKRRQDAHEKIKLGGLIVKAGLRSEDRAFILGALMMAADNRTNEGFRRSAKHRGQRALSQSDTI